MDVFLLLVDDRLTNGCSCVMVFDAVNFLGAATPILISFFIGTRLWLSRDDLRQDRDDRGTDACSSGLGRLV